MTITTEPMTPERRREIVPPAQRQTSLSPHELLHSANGGIIVERTAQVRAEFRNEARLFARELAEHINTKQVGVASVLVFEETFGIKDHLHFLIHLRSLDSYYPMVLMGDQDRAYRESIAKERVDTGNGGGAWDRLFVDGSLRETVLLPQFWGMYGTRVDGNLEKQSTVYRGSAQSGLPPARAQTTQTDQDVLHSGNAGIVLHRTAQIVYDFRSEARQFGREVAESINNNLAGDCTVFVYEEAFGVADRLHWLIHFKDLTTYLRLLELHVRDEAVRDLYFQDRIAPEKGGGTWARMFVEGSMVDTALTPQHWGLYATVGPAGASPVGENG
jgi:hypothetical protein